MAWVPIHAGRDHLQQFARRPAIDAIAELIWNGLDAEADVVDVDIDTQSMIDGSREMTYVTRITVTDNGHGMTPDKAQEAFASLGDSWKRNLNGRTINGTRALHGSQGRGRFFAYSLGHRARWTSVATGDDGFTRLHITGDQARIDGFTIGGAKPDSGPTGTTVVVDVEQGRSLAALTRDDVVHQVAGRLAAHLLGNKDITVRVNGRKVDPRPLIEGEPVEQPLTDVPAEDLGGREVPVLLLVDWTDEMRSAPGVVLCTEDGASLVEVEYLYLDGSHFKMHPGAGAEPVLVAWGITTEGKPVLLSIEPGSSESIDAWWVCSPVLAPLRAVVLTGSGPTLRPPRGSTTSAAMTLIVGHGEVTSGTVREDPEGTRA